jgi:hypothetical protein
LHGDNVQQQEQSNLKPLLTFRNHYKEIVGGLLTIRYPRNLKGKLPFIPRNIYSEAALMHSPPSIADPIRKFRDLLCKSAQDGTLIQEKIVVVFDPPKFEASISLAPYDPESDGLDYPYLITMSAFIYDEIKNGRIRSKGEAISCLFN